jgi:putative endonuclease
MWCVYLLRCGDGTLYAGMTNDLAARFKAHQAGRGARYTRGRGPLEVVHVERCRGRSAALKREHALKRLPRSEKLAMLDSATSRGTTRLPCTEPHSSPPPQQQHSLGARPR